MCFDPDYDWHAEVFTDTPGPADSSVNCDECGKRIQAGEWRRNITAQEHEHCQICEEWGDEYDEEDPQDPITCKHKFGETMEYDRCEACDQILQAIEDVEIKEGCPPHARRPGLFELRETFAEHSSAPHYAARAIEMFPSLGSIPWLVEEAGRIV